MNLGRLLLFAGLGLVALGAVVLLMNRLNLPVGRLPGDFVWRGRTTTLYFPIVTCLLLSLIGTLVMWIVNRR